MKDKYEVIETQEARKIIINKLDSEAQLHLTDRSSDFDIILDAGAKELLKIYYENK